MPMRLKKGNKIHSQSRDYLYKISLNDFCKYLKNTMSNTQSKIARNAGDKTEKQDYSCFLPNMMRSCLCLSDRFEGHLLQNVS